MACAGVRPPTYLTRTGHSRNRHAGWTDEQTNTHACYWYSLTDGVQKLLATRRQGRGPPRYQSPLTTESLTLRKLATFADDQHEAKLLYHQSGGAGLESWMRTAGSRRRPAAGGHKLAGGE